jgi:hypothetical protein
MLPGGRGRSPDGFARTPREAAGPRLGLTNRGPETPAAGPETAPGRRPSQKSCNLTHCNHYVMELSQTGCTGEKWAVMNSR